MKDIFECHITFDRKYGDQVRGIAKQFGWKYSQIDGDPVLGKDVFCYLTSHDDHFINMNTRMTQVAEASEDAGAKVLRKKIELIIYDTKRIV